MHLRRRTKIGLWCTTIFAFVAAGLLSSIAWFDKKQNAIEADVTGSVVEEYFHCGSGTQSDPYVITRPIHYYHLVEFFQRLTDLPKTDGYSRFGTDYLYFQVGYDLDGSGVRKVYNYSDTGVYLGLESTPSLSTTLNMAYYSGENALLPIGTNEVPFIGSFDGGATNGGGITIDNLNIQCSESVLVGNNTVTRTASDIGVFGYVADKDGNNNPTVIQNAYFTNLTLDLSDIGATANASQSTISHIDSHTAPHVGYIAGHVHSYTNYNGTGPVNATPLHDVYVNGARILGGAGTNCNYGYLGKVDTIDGQAPSANMLDDQIDELAEAKDGVGQGGSMDMAKMYRRLLYYYRSMSGYEGASHTFDGVFPNSSPSYGWRVNRDVDINGTETLHSSETTDQMLIHAPSAASNDKQLGTVSIWNRHKSSSLPTNEDIMYLTGGRWAYGNIEQEVEHLQMRITLDGTNFLTVTGASTFASAAESASSIWTVSGSSSKIFTTYNGAPIYLYNNSGTLALTTAEGSATTWSIEDDGNTLCITSGNYELTCNAAGTWSLRSAFVGYRIRNSGAKFIGASSSSSGATITTTSEDLAVIWNYDGNGRLRSIDGRYLTCDTSGPTGKLTSSTTNSFLTYHEGTSTQIKAFPWNSFARLRVTVSGKQYRIRFSSNQFQVFQTGANLSNQILYCEPAYSYNGGISRNYIVGIVLGPDTENVADSGMEYKSENTSIIPLNVVKDGDFTTKENYYAARKNNGYLTAGSSFAAIEPFDGLTQSEVRVSRYPISRIGKSYNSSTKVLNNIRTIHGSSDSQTDDVLTNDEKNTDLYKRSVASLQETLDDEVTTLGAANAYVYGLHFMNAAITTDRLIKSQYAIINGSVKTNYEFPVDVIDFNLHEKKGFVNFFAGTYFSGNNTFFSLHDLLRNGNSISEIKEIEEIYSDGNDNHSYVYKYSDGLYSQPYDVTTNKNIDSDGVVTSANYVKSMDLASKPSTYSTLAFSTARIKVANGTIGSNLNDESGNKDTLYYFEIPINRGEYALGSVPGKNGAYLIYLDVGTNGSLGDNTTNMIANAPLFTQIGISSGAYFVNSVFNVGYIIPAGATRSTFSIAVSINESDTYCFDLIIINTTGQTFVIDVLLSDDNDDPTDSYPYKYSITYNGGSQTVYTGSNSYTGDSGATSMTPTYT